MSREVRIDGMEDADAYCTDSREFMESCEYGVIAIDVNSINEDGYTVLHFVGYLYPPTEKDIEALYEELRTDKEFNLYNRNDWELRICPEEVFDEIKDEALRYAEFEKDKRVH